jgi:4-hydroxy-3-polyprenylbenzoate decarboxylase
MRCIVAITGASGSLYAQRLLDALDPAEHEVHVVLSATRRRCCRRRSRGTATQAGSGAA